MNKDWIGVILLWICCLWLYQNTISNGAFKFSDDQTLVTIGISTFFGLTVYLTFAFGHLFHCSAASLVSIWFGVLASIVITDIIIWNIQNRSGTFVVAV